MLEEDRRRRTARAWTLAGAAVNAVAALMWLLAWRAWDAAPQDAVVAKEDDVRFVLSDVVAGAAALARDAVLVVVVITVLRWLRPERQRPGRVITVVAVAVGLELAALALTWSNAVTGEASYAVEAFRYLASGLGCLVLARSAARVQPV